MCGPAKKVKKVKKKKKKKKGKHEKQILSTMILTKHLSLERIAQNGFCSREIVLTLDLKA